MSEKPSRDEMIAHYIEAIQRINRKYGFGCSSQETLELMIKRYIWRYQSPPKPCRRKKK